MNRSRFLGMAVLSLILAGTITRPVSSYEKVMPVCAVYSLADLGDDPKLCKWIADTIPQVIQPDTWGTCGDSKRVLTYYAPAKIMVVYQTVIVHEEVATFLKNVRKTLPQGKETAARTENEPTVVPARFVTPRPVPRTVVKGEETEPATSPGYPVPAQPRQPKHLFHFIIRYEGQGIIDDNVADLCKEMYGRKATEEEGQAKSKDKDDDEKGKGKEKPKATYCAPATSQGILLPTAPQGALGSLPPPITHATTR